MKREREKEKRKGNGKGEKTNLGMAFSSFTKLAELH